MSEAMWLKKRAKSVASKSSTRSAEETMIEASKLSKPGWTEGHKNLSKDLSKLSLKRKLETQQEGALLPSEKAFCFDHSINTFNDINLILLGC